MALLIGFLTFILVMNCLFLILLILIQLPKKEAGAGIAFGGAATDALFGAGSGNALTKMTKYSGSVFVGLAVLLSVLNMSAAKQGSRRLDQELSRQASNPAARTAPVLPSSNTVAQTPAPSAATPTTTLASTTNLMSLTSTNAAPVPAPGVSAEAPATTPAPAK